MINRLGDLQEIRAMGAYLREAMGNHEVVNPWPGSTSKPITDPTDVVDPWADKPTERIPARPSRGHQATRAPSKPAPKRWEQLSPQEQKSMRERWRASAEGKAIVDPWGPRPPGPWRPGSGL